MAAFTLHSLSPLLLHSSSTKSANILSVQTTNKQFLTTQLSTYRSKFNPNYPSSKLTSSFLHSSIFHKLGAIHNRKFTRTKYQTEAVSTLGSNQTYPQNEKNDFIEEILSKNPSHVEPKILVNENLYTLKEFQNLNASVFEKLIFSIKQFYSQTLPSKEIKPDQTYDFEKSNPKLPAQNAKSTQNEIQNEIQDESQNEDEKSNTVYLKQLLREFRGNLYVPEEAFKQTRSEVNDFYQKLQASPLMTVDEFQKYAESNQVKVLTSRAVRSPKDGFLYTDFLVELKDIDGERSLHQDIWSLKLDEAESKKLLLWYDGPQKEIETSYSAYIEVPTKTPQLAAATFSSRVVLESSVLLTLTLSLAIFAKSFATSATFAIIALLSTLTLRLLWPIAMPFVLPFYWLAVTLVKGVWGIISAVLFSIILPAIEDAAVSVADFGQYVISRGLKGIIESIMEFADTVSTQFSATSIKTFSTMVLILILMTAMAKFSMNRRTRNYNKWDIWQALEFAQSKSDARVEGGTGVKFEDIAGIDEVVHELKELVAYLKDPERFNTMGTKPPHGVLLEGPPGCGKTLLAKAIAGEAGVPFYQMAGSEFVEVLVGVGAARMRDLFKRAKVNKPSVVFIDEIDAVGAARGGMKEGSIDQNAYDSSIQERETTLNQLLIELDGFDTGQGVIFMGATNRMDLLDPALLRPGRFDRKIGIRPPKAQGRFEILKVHSKNYKLDESVDLWTYAKNLPGWSGAELAHLLRESALACVRRNGHVIGSHDIDVALDRLTLGVERLDSQLRINPHLLKRRAVHELGIGLTAMVLKTKENALIEPLQRLSITPRGNTLSRTVFDRIDDENYVFETRKTLIHRMQIFLGGRAAEMVIFGRDTSPLSLLHVQDAAWLAYKMISIWQMGEKGVMRGVPPVWIRESKVTGPLLTFEGSLYDTYGLTDCKIGNKADTEIANMSRKLFDSAFLDTVQLLQNHKAALVKSVYVLLEKKELYRDELHSILEHYPENSSVDAIESEEEPSLLPTVEEKKQVNELEAAMHEFLEEEIQILP